MSRFGYEKPRQDKSGKRWNFCYWQSPFAFSGEEKKHKSQRLFFWDDEKELCGAVLFPSGHTVPYTRIKNLIIKLVAEPDLRAKYKREVQFPLERYYSTYPVFSEELESSQ
jgi:hypothetical protein